MKLIVGTLYLTVILSALQIIISVHESRRVFIEMQSLLREQDMLNEQWGRLRIEQGTWATDDRIEQIARTEFKMQIPSAAQTILLPRP